MGKLEGKTAVITGGNSGIGYATAKLFLEEGAKVIITGRNESAVNEAVKTLGPNAHGITSDARNMADINALPGKVAGLTDKVDILFANAGVGLFAPFEQTTEEVFDSNIDINFKGVFFTVQKLLPMIPERGSIILNSSILAHSGAIATSAYSASKGALQALNKTLAIELAPKNIRVNCIDTGPISTPIYGKMGMSEEQQQAFAEDIRKQIPLLQFGKPEDVAEATLFLASEGSGFMTGSEITVDGGKAAAF